VREEGCEVTAYFGIALGVCIAIVYPVLRGFVTKQFPPTAAPGLPPWVKKYSALLVFSLLTALIILATYKSANPHKDISFFAALGLGFGWESSIEKVFTTKP
jgi:predicted lysophospholipase L1 biosynthesis ABC-type transport system permease subunit